MSRRSDSKREVHRYLLPWCLLLALTWLIWPGAVMPQVTDQPSVMFEVVRWADLGLETEVSITWVNTDSTFEVGGFDILFSYDAEALFFQSAEQGQLLTDCDWEYFTYRFESSPPDYGLVRVVALAETNNGDDHPICYANSSGELINLRFRVTDDPAYDCQWVPLRFYWADCSDNIFAAKSGDPLLVSRDVYDYDWASAIYVQINQDSSFPTYFGAPESCIDSIPPGLAIRMIDFYNGSVLIKCHDTIDVRGDVNLNGVPNEIADWVLFINYFLYGLEAFTINEELQIQATDVNMDGIPLTLDDLVYLWRIIIGDAVPFPKLTDDTAVFIQDPDTKTVSITYPDSLSAAYLVFRGNIVPASLVEELDLYYNFDGMYTRVVAFSSGLEGPPPIFAPGPLLSYTGIGVLEEAYTSDYGTYQIPTEIEVLANLEAKAEVEPTVMFAYWAFVINPIVGTTYVGNFAGPSVTDIDPSTILINDVIEPMSTQILPGRPGFTGEVMEITLSASELVHDYLPFFDTTSQVYMVAGQFTDLTPFTVFGDVTLVGHVSGDVNLDGRLNVADVTYLVEYLFFGGPPPQSMETADLNHSGGVEVADLTLLVELLF
jgi:hypothetical protein